MSIVKGRRNYLSFDGVNDSINVGRERMISDFEGSSYIDIEITFELDEIKIDRQVFIDFGIGLGGNSFVWLVSRNNGSLWFGGRSTDENFESVEVSSVLSANVEYTVNGRLDFANDKIILELDGTEIANESVTFDSNTAQNQNDTKVDDIDRIGINISKNSDNYLNGKISYIKLQSNVYTTEWLFDEGSGTILNDSAGNNDGTITGATWGVEGVSNIYYGGPITDEQGEQYILLDNYNFEQGSTNWISSTNYTFNNDLCIITGFPTSAWGGQNVSIIQNHTYYTAIKIKRTGTPRREDFLLCNSVRGNRFIEISSDEKGGGITPSFNILTQVHVSEENMSRLYFGIAGGGTGESGTFDIDFIALFDLTELKNQGIIANDTEEAFNDVFTVNFDGSVTPSYPIVPRVYKGGPSYYLSFDGDDDYVDISNNQTGLVKELTIEFRPTNDIVPDGTTQNIFSWRGVSSSEGYGVWLGDFTGAISDETIIFNVGVNHNTRNFYKTGTISSSQWNEIKFLWNGTTYDLYFNNVLQTIYDDGKPVVNQVPIDDIKEIGRRYINNDFYYNGDIRYIKVLDNNDNIAIEYDFSDGSGTTLTDKAGNNDGTIVGATWETLYDNVIYGEAPND